MLTKKMVCHLKGDYDCHSMLNIIIDHIVVDVCAHDGFCDFLDITLDSVDSLEISTFNPKPRRYVLPLSSGSEVHDV